VRNPISASAPYLERGGNAAHRKEGEAEPFSCIPAIWRAWLARSGSPCCDLDGGEDGGTDPTDPPDPDRIPIHRIPVLPVIATQAEAPQAKESL